MSHWVGMRTGARWFLVATGVILMLGLGAVALVHFPIPILPFHEQLAEGEIAEEGSERDLPKRRESKVATQPANDESALIRPAGAPQKGLRRSFDSPDLAHALYLRERLSASVPAYPLHRIRAILDQIKRRETLLADARKNSGGPAGIQGWRELGPGNIGGRTRALAIDPIDPEVIYAGGVSGGVWKSIDGGVSWRATDDLMLNLAVTTIAIDPVDPHTLYAGTGEGFFWPYSMARGLGIFKSTDAGETWSQLQGTVTGQATNAFHYIHEIVISPIDHERLFAATQFGVWRSDDGGLNWTVALANPRFIFAAQTSRGSTVGCTDIAIRGDTDPDTLLAAFGVYESDGLYRSEDGGDTWTRVLTTENQGRMTVAFAPSDPRTAYVAMAANRTGTFGKLVDVFRSTDGGVNWAPRVDMSTRLGPWLLSNSVYATGCAQDQPTYHQGWYDNVIAVDPVDPDSVWVGASIFFDRMTVAKSSTRRACGGRPKFRKSRATFTSMQITTFWRFTHSTTV